MRKNETGNNTKTTCGSHIVATGGGTVEYPAISKLSERYGVHVYGSPSKVFPYYVEELDTNFSLPELEYRFGGKRLPEDICDDERNAVWRMVGDIIGHVVRNGGSVRCDVSFPGVCLATLEDVEEHIRNLRVEGDTVVVECECYDELRNDSIYVYKPDAVREIHGVLFGKRS